MKAIYTIYDLRKYYPSFVGANHLAVVSDLTQDELMQSYPSLRKKAPFALFTEKQWYEAMSAIHDYDLNEKKYQMQAIRHEVAFDYHDGVTELEMSDIDEYHVMDEYQVVDDALNNIALEQLHAAMDILTDTQKRRIMLHYSGYSYHEIAVQEQVSKQTIMLSIRKGIRKLQKKLNVF